MSKSFCLIEAWYYVILSRETRWKYRPFPKSTSRDWSLNMLKWSITSMLWIFYLFLDIDKRNFQKWEDFPCLINWLTMLSGSKRNLHLMDYGWRKTISLNKESLKLLSLIQDFLIKNLSFNSINCKKLLIFTYNVALSRSAIVMYRCWQLKVPHHKFGALRNLRVRSPQPLP